LGKHDQPVEAQSAQQDERAPPAPPCAMVIFGAAGDLTKRLVAPTVYNLAHAGQLSDGFQLTLFQRADTVEAGWQAVQPILDGWAKNPPRDFPNSAAGGAGPAAADKLLARDDRTWRPLG
jgi:glucose-6-phosphate 1-dehydrogenase